MNFPVRVQTSAVERRKNKEKLEGTYLGEALISASLVLHFDIKLQHSCVFNFTYSICNRAYIKQRTVL